MPEEHRLDFAERLRRARRAAGLSQEELAERAGVSVRAISALERGINRAPRPDTLAMLANALALSGDERHAWERLRRQQSRHSIRGRTTATAAGEIPPGADDVMVVGRERETERVVAFLNRARTGQGSIILVGGEAGIGKSTLVRVAARAATECGFRVLIGGCYDLTTTPPYGPWIAIVDHVLPGRGTPRLPILLQHHDPSGAGMSQAALLAEARAFFVTLATARPILLVLEDLHWSDTASLELLRVVARTVQRIPLVLIATYRDTEVMPGHPLFDLLPVLVRESTAERIDLQPLRDPDLNTLINQRYRLSERDTDRLRAYLMTHTEGNPFYATEVLRALEEAQLLRSTPAGWVLSDLRTVVVPPLIRQVILSRVTRLDETSGNLLRVAAVIGQDVPLDVWSAVSEAADDDVLAAVERAAAASLITVAEDGLSVRFRHALVREALYGSILPLRRRLWHQRIAEVVERSVYPSPDEVAYHYQAASDARAVVWLVRAGERAERSYAWTIAAARFEAALPLLEADPSAARLRGWMLLHLGYVLRFATRERGLAYLETAIQLGTALGDRALTALAGALAGGIRSLILDVGQGLAELEAAVAAQNNLTTAEWIEAFRRQRSLIDPLPFEFDVDDPQAIEAARLTSQQTGYLVCMLTLLTLRYQDAVALGESYAMRIGGVNDALLLQHTSTLEGASWIDTFLGLGGAYAVLGHVEAAERAYARALSLYRAAAHHVIVVVMALQHAWLVKMPYRADDATERMRWVADVEDSERHLEGIYGEGWSPGMVHLPTLLVTGAWDEARAIAMNIIEHQPPVFAMLAEVALGVIERARGNHDAIWAIVRRRLPGGPTADPTGTFAIAVFDLAQLAAAAALDCNDLATARQWLEAHDDWIARSGRVLGRAEGNLLWARLQMLDGNWDRAREQVQAAIEHASTPRQPLALLAAQRLLGNIATHDRNLHAGEQHLAAALDLADACHARFERALTLLALAELRAATGDTREACRFVEEVRLICRPLGATPILRHADDLIERVMAG